MRHARYLLPNRRRGNFVRPRFLRIRDALGELFLFAILIKRLRRRLILASVLSVGLPGVWMIIGPVVSEMLRNPEDDWYDIRVVGSATMVVAVGMLLGLVVILSIALLSTSPSLPLRCWWAARVAPFAVACVIGGVVAPIQPPFFTGLAVVAAFFASGITAALALGTREHWHALRSGESALDRTDSRVG